MRSQLHGTRWLKFGSIQMIKAVCTVATVSKEIVLSALCQSVQIVAMLWFRVEIKYLQREMTYFRVK